MIGHEDLKDFECPICLEFCRDAVESECCAHAFCSTCADEFVQKKKCCPCCRSQDFKAKQSRLMRRIISQIRVECANKGCEEKLQNADKQKHELECPYRQLKCKHCDKEMMLKHIYEHTLDAHADEAKKMIMSSYVPQTQKSKISSASKVLEGEYNPLAKVRNAKGRDAGFGDHIKYYCGGDLAFKCRCCDGHCGPTNGENCVDCMRLDVEFHKLGKGCLVNALGNIAKIEENEAFCGALVRTLSNKLPCTRKAQCQACRNLTSSLPRYKTLL